MNCHGCKTIKSDIDMRYLCMCETESIPNGICKVCAAHPQWEEKVPPNHIVEMLHDLTPEHKTLLAEVEAKCGQWARVQPTPDGKRLEVLYYQNDSGETGQAFEAWLLANKLTYDNMPQHMRKKRTFDMPAKLCTCCS